MESKQRFFIYGRREMGVLILLAFMVAIFAFTLGVHLGKRATPKITLAKTTDVTLAATTDDKVPGKQELNEQAKNVNQASDDALRQALHEEISKTGIKLDRPRQIQLPSETAAEKQEVAPEPETKTEKTVGKFSLQIGSYPSLDEAKGRTQTLAKQGLQAFFEEADVKGAKWYRVYLGRFTSKDQAEKAGENYRSKHWIASFIVAKPSE